MIITVMIMAYLSIYIIMRSLEDKIRIPARPCNILYVYSNVGVLTVR